MDLIWFDCKPDVANALPTADWKFGLIASIGFWGGVPGYDDGVALLDL